MKPKPNVSAAPRDNLALYVGKPPPDSRRFICAHALI